MCQEPTELLWIDCFDRINLGPKIQIRYVAQEILKTQHLTWKGDVLIADLEELETMDASEIYSKRLNAKEVIFPKQGEFIFPIADGRIKTRGGDQELRTCTLVRHRPIQGESNIDFLGESEGSLPQPHDSLPVAGEAMNDFWSMSGSFIYRHHVEPWVKLYSPKEESFPIPLKYIDVSRTTHTNLDVKQEKHIDDYWNIDDSRDLSDPWKFHTIYNFWKRNLQTDFCGPVRDWQDGSYIQARSFLARALEQNEKKTTEGETWMVRWRTETR